MAARTDLVHPDDRAAQRAAREAGVAGRGEYVVEVRLRRHDGVYRWHRIHNAPVVRAGERIGYVGTAVDIHEAKLDNEALEQRVAKRTAALRESKGRYRTLYNRTPVALHSLDPTGG